MASSSFDDDDDLDGLSIGSEDDLRLDGLSLGSDSEEDAIPCKPRKNDVVFFSLLQENAFEDRHVIAAATVDEPIPAADDMTTVVTDPVTPKKQEASVTGVVAEAAKAAMDRSTSKVSSPNPFDNPHFAPKPSSPRVNPESLANASKLADSAPKSASKLPDFGQVTHSGYVLARISIRTILLKKWKQVYWVTYGVNQILFFRSVADFEEWVSNPFLTINQREHLVKLKIDLVGDLAEKGVAGYTVTPKVQKLYKANNYHTFKLEKWIASGPIICAAFASLIESDVSNLRTIFLEMGRKSTLLRQSMGQI